MDGACNTEGNKMRNLLFFNIKPKEREHFGDVGTDGHIIQQ
jgi:hypothetical protein